MAKLNYPMTHEAEYYKLNTSNPGKLKEFQALFKEHGLRLETSQIDLDEIDADPISVIVHKASQMEDGILVEDTSLDVEGAEIGISIRWLLDKLEQYVGRKATWTVLLARKLKDKVYLYKGEVIGTIVNSRHTLEGFGFDPYFLPEGSTKTLSEEKPACFNARALAVDNFVKNNAFAIHPPIDSWKGKWQE